MYHNNREVDYSRIQPAIEKLIVFLAKFEKVALVGHNCKSFDIPVLLSALENNNMLESFMSTGVIGVINTLPLLRYVFLTCHLTPNLKYMKQCLRISTMLMILCKMFLLYLDL